jgi:16S rRNA C1402 N4-methylase RsmH
MRLTEKVHHLLTNHLEEGDRAIDATAGNGYDTLFLAEQVGSSGQVIAIDIQANAIEATLQKIATAQFEERVSLQQGDHAIVLEKLTESHRSNFSAIVFNLGYLPGSDKNVQTEASNTEKALKASLQLIRENGALYVTAYRGHPGGAIEAHMVENWMRAQEAAGHTVKSYEPASENTPPILWVLKVACP